MIATQTDPSQFARSIDLAQDYTVQPIGTGEKSLARKKHSVFLPGKVVSHNPKAGINAIVDAASYIFSLLGKVQTETPRQSLKLLHQEFVTEINRFQQTIHNHGYPTEYIGVCGYLLCATIDDIVGKTAWGNDDKWQPYALLASFKGQDKNNFFNLLEHVIKEPALYIDVIELGFICLTLGYQGVYGETDDGLIYLNELTHQLYKHVRAYRGNISKILSPASLKINKMKTAAQQKKNTSFGFIFLVTACTLMTIFISLGYLMDIISNEAYNIGQTQSTITVNNS